MAVTNVPGPTAVLATTRLPCVISTQPWTFWRITLPGFRPLTRNSTPDGLRSTPALVRRSSGCRGPGTRTATPTA